MSKIWSVVLLFLCCSHSWGASKQGAILTAQGYLSRALKEDNFSIKFPQIYNNALKISKALQDFNLNIISISCPDRSFGLTKAGDSELYRKSGALQFRICEKHWLNSDEEVASTIIHELTHLVAKVPDDIEVSMHEMVIIYYGGGFAGLSYFLEDLNESTFDDFLETEEFKGFKEIGITNKSDFLYNLICGYARYNYPNKLKGLLKKMPLEVRSYLINSQQNKLGLSPLMIAAREGFVEPLKILLEFGAKTDLKSEDGKTAFDFAKMNQKSDIIHLLLKE